MYNPLLNTFIVTADCKSFNKAAQQLYITPASVMNQMNALEAHLGIRLFIRGRQGLILTKAGESVYSDAKKIMLESQRALERARDIQKKASEKTIRIGSSFLNPCQILLDFWQQNAAFCNEYKFRIIPYSDDRYNILSVVQMLGKKMDLLAGPFDSPSLSENCGYLKLGECTACIAMAPSHALAKKELLSIKDLEGEHLIVPHQEQDGLFSSFMRAHPKILFKEQGTFYDMDTFNECVQQGDLMLTLDIWSGIHPLLVTIPVDWELKTAYGILYARDAGEVVLEFVHELEVLSEKTGSCCFGHDVRECR